MGMVQFLFREILSRLSQRPWKAIAKAFRPETWTKIFALSQGETVQPRFVPVLPPEINAVLSQGRVDPFFPPESRIQLPLSDSPVVSVVIPVYNQVVSTLFCLQSIARFSDDVPLEVILADDGSTDETVRISEWVSSLRVVKTPENRGFLRNCNHAAQAARGQFLLFLNNDTYVQPGWLRSLVETFRDPRVGLAGSMLIYPDGTLQEAGVILWNDGSGANVGRGDNPTKPQFNFVRDVDTISGASIMVPRDLFQSLGGFDERYAPAYYEDTDLAFQIRQRGLVVRYQPASKVIHFEGVSHGRDEKVGIKAYQVANRQKFVDKWTTTLAKDHLSPASDWFFAREQPRRGRTILVLDEKLPLFDRDAGSRSTWQYLLLLQEEGNKVIFVPASFQETQPYTSLLQERGIEVLAGPWFKNQVGAWFRENLRYIDVVFLHRPLVAEAFLKYLDARPELPIVYHGHDLHWLRTRRQYEATGNPKYLKASEGWEKLERRIFARVSRIVTVSHDEKPLIDGWTGDPRKTTVMPLLFFPGEPAGIPCPSLSERRGLLFVGGFTHQPNVDAVRWLAEAILPLLDPAVVVSVVGAHASDALLSLGSERFRFLGPLSDEALREEYERAALVIAPLRFGAGVKGKVLEAFRLGVPVVGTPVAYEGLGLDLSQWPVAEEPQGLAQHVGRLCGSPELWQALSEQGQRVISDSFHRASAVNAMRTALGIR